MIIYFAGSIRGGRDQTGIYQQMIIYLKKFGKVVTEHVGDPNLTEQGEKEMTDHEIYDRDLTWLKTADIVVAEVSNPSLGVGFEIAKAIDLNKKVICFFKKNSEQSLSAMISGCPDLNVEEYQNPEDFEQKAESFISKHYAL